MVFSLKFQFSFRSISYRSIFYHWFFMDQFLHFNGNQSVFENCPSLVYVLNIISDIARNRVANARNGN